MNESQTNATGLRSFAMWTSPHGVHFVRHFYDIFLLFPVYHQFIECPKETCVCFLLKSIRSNIFEDISVVVHV